MALPPAVGAAGAYFTARIRVLPGLGSAAKLKLEF